MEWREWSGGNGVEGKYIIPSGMVDSFCGQLLFLLPTSAKDIHWTSSFLPPDIFLREGKSFHLASAFQHQNLDL